MLIIVSCLLTLRSLTRSKRDNVYSVAAGMLPDLHALQAPKRTATVNILILTMVYLAFNLFSCAIHVMDSLEIFSDGRIRFDSALSDSSRTFIQTFAWTHVIALNSTCNVVVYFCRLSSLRQFCVSLFFRRQRDNVTTENHRSSFPISPNGTFRMQTLLASPSDINFTWFYMFVKQFIYF